MEQSSLSTAGKRLWHIARVFFYMIRKGFTKDKLMMELSLLFKRGKIAGKALGNLMAFHHHHQHSHSTSSIYSSFSCRSMDPDLSYYNPKEVEFSCSNTPSFPSFHSIKGKSHQRRRRHHDYEFDANMIAKAFEILNYEASETESFSVMPSPSATPLWSIYVKSPAVATRQLRITDSPFPMKEEEENADGEVDVKAEEFIKRFYKELQLQQRMVPETPPPVNWNRRREPISSRA